MGDGAQPGADGARPALTTAGLAAWRDSGATWRVLELGESTAVVELCTCMGEPVDVLAGAGPELVAFLRAHPVAGE